LVLAVVEKSFNSGQGVTGKSSGTAVLGTGHCVNVSVAARRNAVFAALSAIGLSRRNLLQITILASAAALLSSCGNSTYSWSQKLTVTVQTPQGEKSGSAVVGIKAWYGNVIDVGRTADIKLQGEAAVVDLGNGKYLFALLGEEDKSRAWQTFHDELPKGTAEAWAAISGMQGHKKELLGARYPMLVTFGNLSDPKSVKQASDVSATFGSGYSLKSMTLEITDEPVTDGVVGKLLPWLGPYPEPGLCPAKGETDASKIPFCRKVQNGDFVRKVN
jgi:hypothetical protein